MSSILNNTILKNIERLANQRELVRAYRYRTYSSYGEPGLETYGYAKLTLYMAFLDLKKALWRSLLK